MMKNKNRKGKRTSLGVLLVVCMALCIFPPMRANAIANVVTVAGYYVPQDVTSLDLQKVTIDDFNTFVTELSQLPYLSYVDLSNSNLTNEQMEILQGYFPCTKFVWVVKMKKWSLRTDTKAFSTMQADTDVMLQTADIQVLKYCKDLVALDLGHHNVTDLSVLMNCQNLRILIMSSNNWLTNIYPVAYLPNLMYFECWCSRISDLTPLVACQNLVDLNVSFVFSKINSIDPLLHFPKLERLWFTHSGVSEADRIRLQERYPDVAMDWTSEDSKSNGWRTHARFKSMRSMYFNNTVEGDFLTNVPEYDTYMMLVNRDFYFDPVYYGTMHPDVYEAVGGDAERLFWHFMVYGMWAGEQGNAFFNVNEYINTHPIMVQAAGDYIPKYYAAYIMSCLNAQSKEL